MLNYENFYIYPAFISNSDGFIFVNFPDLPGCVTQGDSLESALKSAQEALEGFLYCLEIDNDVIPKPTPMEKLKIPSGVALAMISARMDMVREEERRRGENHICAA